MTLIGNINIFSTPGNTTYTTLFDQSGSSTGFITEAAKTPSGVFPVLMLLFKGDLSNPGTDFLETGLLNGGGEGSCVAADCSGPNDPTQTRFITGGEACSAGSSCVAVPEPSTLSLLGMALVVLLAGATIRRVSHV
jgi:hypothetical protein